MLLPDRINPFFGHEFFMRFRIEIVHLTVNRNKTAVFFDRRSRSFRFLTDRKSIHAKCRLKSKQHKNNKNKAEKLFTIHLSYPPIIIDNLDI